MMQYGEALLARAFRRRSIVGPLIALVAILVTLNGTGISADELPADHADQMARSLELFKADVRGLLVQNCLQCHGGEKTNGELDLSTREGLIKGGEQGPAIVVGKPAESRLVQ